MGEIIAWIYTEDEWNVDLDAQNVSLKIEKGHSEEKDLDGKPGEFRLDGLEAYASLKEGSYLFTLPAEIQIYEDSDVREFSIVLPKDFLVYRSNELPPFISHLAGYWFSQLDFCFQETERGRW